MACGMGRNFGMGMLGLALALGAVVPAALGQSGAGWVTIVDGKAIGDWDRVAESNWRIEDGALVADKAATKDASYLVTKKSYRNFEIHAEFWASDDANSGIFIRCQDRKKIGANNCYEVNIFDQRKDPTYGTGAVVDFAEVNPMPKAGGKWNTFQITAKDRQITVVLNGQKTVDFRNNLFKEGPFALQHGSGVIKFRKVSIREL